MIDVLLSLATAHWVREKGAHEQHRQTGVGGDKKKIHSTPTVWAADRKALSLEMDNRIRALNFELLSLIPACYARLF